MLYCTIHALGELAAAFPIASAFSVYSSRFIDPSWGFAMRWCYGVILKIVELWDGRRGS